MKQSAYYFFFSFSVFLCAISLFQCVSERPNVAGMSPGDIARELAIIHQMCVCHLEELREYSERQVR